ncbi:MAG: N utilization substance protein B [Gallionellaceae bacterium]|nr:MAG: N utilization substance protein B [Gallionellaceae bacterium]
MSGRAAEDKAPARSPRHRSRELALQGIYQWRLVGGDSAQIEKQICGEKGLGRYDSALFKELLGGALAQHAELEAVVAPQLDRDMAELNPIEFSILLLGAYELVRHPEISYRIIINEAVELAKTFGGTDGHKYVNGVLDKLAAQMRSSEVTSRRL